MQSLGKLSITMCTLLISCHNLMIQSNSACKPSCQKDPVTKVFVIAQQVCAVEWQAKSKQHRSQKLSGAVLADT